MNDNINMAIAGIGLIHATGKDEDYGSAHVERLTMTGLLRPFGLDPEILADQGAIGDFSYNVFDADGKGRPDWQFFLTAGANSHHEGLDFYKNLVKRKQRVIAIAGERKIDALRAALKGKLFNVLITDYDTAFQLCGRKHWVLSDLPPVKWTVI